MKIPEHHCPLARAPIHIDNFNDPQIDVYRDVRDADLRGRDRLFMAESELVIRRLLRTPDRLHSLLLSPQKYDRLRSDIEAADEFDSPIYLADVTLISEIAGFHIHRGALAAGYRPAPDKLSLDNAIGHLRSRNQITLLLAEGITNVDNMGGLFRNAAAFGVDGVVLDPTCCDPLYRKAIRVSAGHALSVPYAVSDNWPADLARLRTEWSVTLVGAEAVAQSQPLWTIPADAKLAMLFGAEATGLREQTLQQCDAVCEIPMQGAVPSLNVATASAVFLYERQRQQSACSKSER